MIRSRSSSGSRSRARVAIAIALVLTVTVSPLVGAVVASADSGETTVSQVEVNNETATTAAPTNATATRTATLTEGANATATRTTSGPNATATAVPTATATEAPTSTASRTTSTTSEQPEAEDARTRTDRDRDRDRDRTETPTESESSGSSSSSDSDNATSVVAEVDSQLRVTDYHYNDEREVMTVTLEHRDKLGSRSQVTVTEVISDRAAESNSGTFGVETLSVAPGETVEVEVSAKRVDDVAAVMIVTEESLQNGQGTFIADKEAGMSIFDGAPTWGFVRLSGLGAAIGVVLTGLLVAWHQVADNHDKVEGKL